MYCPCLLRLANTALGVMHPEERGARRMGWIGGGHGGEFCALQQRSAILNLSFVRRHRAWAWSSHLH